MTRAPAALVVLAFLAALAWGADSALRPAAMASPAVVATPRDPRAELARARAFRRADAVGAAVGTALLDLGLTPGDLRREMVVGTAHGAVVAATALDVDVTGPAEDAADAIVKAVEPVDGVALERPACLSKKTECRRVVVRLDGADLFFIEVYGAAEASEAPLVSSRPKVAIVIDDLGYSRAPVDKLLAISRHFTFSILPYGPETEAVGEELHARDAEILLHLPMEPMGAPGGVSKKGMLMHGMADPVLQQSVIDALKDVPYADGVNNHMGSRLTAERGPMDAVMEVLAHRSLLFLDSRTTAQTEAYRAARAAGVRALERDVFLDDVAEIGAVLKQVDLLEARAKKRGHAVAIGHPYPSTIEALKQAVPTLIDHGLEIVSLHDLASQSGNDAASLTNPPGPGTP